MPTDHRLPYASSYTADPTAIHNTTENKPESRISGLRLVLFSFNKTLLYNDNALEGKRNITMLTKIKSIYLVCAILYNFI